MPPDRSTGDQPESSRSSRWLPPIVWAAIIQVGTSWPSISVGPDEPIFGIDKVVHFSMYAILSFLVARTLPTWREPRVALLIVLALSTFGALDEWHQAFIPGRSMSFLDWVADTLGILTGLLAARHLLPKTTLARPTRVSP